MHYCSYVMVCYFTRPGIVTSVPFNYLAVIVTLLLVQCYSVHNSLVLYYNIYIINDYTLQLAK